MTVNRYKSHLDAIITMREVARSALRVRSQSIQSEVFAEWPMGDLSLAWESPLRDTLSKH
eukprot:2604085-Amphidinium_carterae.1